MNLIESNQIATRLFGTMSIVLLSCSVYNICHLCMLTRLDSRCQNKAVQWEGHCGTAAALPFDGIGLALGISSLSAWHDASCQSRLVNRPGMAGIVPELTQGVPCPGRGSFESFCPGNVKIDHRAWIYGCSLMSVLYFVLCLSVTHDSTWLECNVTD